MKCLLVVTGPGGPGQEDGSEGPCLSAMASWGDGLRWGHGQGRGGDRPLNEGHLLGSGPPPQRLTTNPEAQHKYFASNPRTSSSAEKFQAAERKKLVDEHFVGVTHGPAGGRPTQPLGPTSCRLHDPHGEPAADGLPVANRTSRPGRAVRPVGYSRGRGNARTLAKSLRLVFPTGSWFVAFSPPTSRAGPSVRARFQSQFLEQGAGSPGTIPLTMERQFGRARFLPVLGTPLIGPGRKAKGCGLQSRARARGSTRRRVRALERRRRTGSADGQGPTPHLPGSRPPTSHVNYRDITANQGPFRVRTKKDPLQLVDADTPPCAARHEGTDVRGADGGPRAT